MTKTTTRPPAIREVRTVTGGRFDLRTYTFNRSRPGGRSKDFDRDVYMRGDTASVLPFDSERSTVLLTRQFRAGALVAGSDDGFVIEVAGGLVGSEDPIAAAGRECAEELGYRVHSLELAVAPYMNPGLLPERSYLFLGEYSERDRVGPGGGLDEEDEDIEVIELPLAKTRDLALTGAIEDGRTLVLILLLAARRLAPLHELVVGPGAVQ